MQVNRMIVAALVGHREAIALTRLGGEQRIRIRPGAAVQGPAVVAAAAAGDLLEQKLDARVRFHAPTKKADGPGFEFLAHLDRLTIKQAVATADRVP